MIELFDRRTGKQLDISDMSRREFMSLVYSPVLVEYQLFYSKIMLEALDYYKDAPLVEHKITEVEKRKLAKDPSYAMDIPKYEIEGYDDFVSNERLERRISTEFYTRFMTGDKELIKMINKYHPIFKAR